MLFFSCDYKDPPLSEDDRDDTEAPPSDTCRKEPSAVVATAQLEELVDSINVRCEACGINATYAIKPISLSFCVTWVSTRFPISVHHELFIRKELML